MGSETAGSSSPAERLQDTIHHLAHYLPAQGPIGVFIHHNTLHAFQHKKFEDAVTEAAQMYGNEPYMLENAYRACYREKRILGEDIDAALAEEPDAELLPDGLRRRELMRKMLVPGLPDVRPETVQWELEEGSLRNNDRALFEYCYKNAGVAESSQPRAVRPRDGVFEKTGIDLDDTVHPLLIKLASAFVDQGLAYWSMPSRDRGFWKASLKVLDQPAVGALVLRLLPKYIEAAKGLNSTEGLLATLEALGIEESEWDRILLAELLALPGWAGMIYRLEVEPELAPHEQIPSRLTDYIAVRMMLTAAAVEMLLGNAKAWRVPRTEEVVVKETDLERTARAARYAAAVQLLGLRPSSLTTLTAGQAHSFFDAVDQFNGFERRRVWHVAYERRHERAILLPMLEHLKRYGHNSPSRLAAQVFFCIDEREESIRRALEEIDPEIETFSAAGFYGVAMNYAGIDDAHGVSLCPVVVKPAHAIRERPIEEHAETYKQRQALRRQWAMLMRHWWVASRTLVRGWIGTTIVGVFNLIPLVARVLTPRQYGKLIEWLNDSVLPDPRTELTYMRSGEAGHAAAEGLVVGFTPQEKIDRVAAVLGPAGLHKGMARLVVILGHGSTSLNNPHESAHDCGACGGRRGGPNGRTFATIANRPEVRKGLRARGIMIPDDTWFVGGYHDTCNDDVDLYDLELVPESHQGDLARVRASLDAARAASAHERARRFEAAKWGINDLGGLHHVQERAEHLAEPRPEYGHCTNAVTIVGRRSATRGLFFDRRAFLVSYDATLDPTNDALGRLLAAVIPVCAGISLEYYFSFVDNEGYGCGTKLPHNVTGLIGVMNGYEGDLRTGLPWQMVEIHEPVRSLFVIESTPQRVLETIHKNALNWEFLNNRWIRLATQDPIDGTIHMYRGGAPGDARWEKISGTDVLLAEARSSREYYDRKREHLPVAHIGQHKEAVGAER
jgi:uncharacterized protein YbcC (UPF0753/DUF2309 family)